jgi:hypothetical protein
MTHTDGLNDVETLINRFGGMRPMARKMDVAVSTIQGWKKRDHIPADRVDDVVNAARTNQISLEGFDLPEGNNDNQKTNTSTEKPTPSVSPLAPKPQARKTPENTIPSASYTKQSIIARSIVTTVSVVAVMGAFGYFLFGNEIKQATEVTSNQQSMESRLDGFRTEFNSFENTITNGLNSLSDQVTDIAAAVGVERNADGQIILNNDLSLSERVTGLESRLRASGEEIDLGQMMTRFEKMTQDTQSGQGVNTQAMSDLRLIIDGLQSRMGEFDAALQQAKDNNAELAQSMDNVTGRDMGAAAMLLAMTQMRESLNRSEPFAKDLAVLQELVGNDDPELNSAIARLAPYAESGVLTPEGLSSEFRGIAGEIVGAALRGEDVSIQDKILGRIGQILSVKKNGEPIMGIEEQAIIARAQTALDNGNVQAAMAELNKLEGDAADVATPFKVQAQGAVNADQTVTLLMQNILDKIQNPQAMKNFIKTIPDQIQNQSQGQLYQDDASGIIILE